MNAIFQDLGLMKNVISLKVSYKRVQNTTTRIKLLNCSISFRKMYYGNLCQNYLIEKAKNKTVKRLSDY